MPSIVLETNMEAQLNQEQEIAQEVQSSQPGSLVTEYNTRCKRRARNISTTISA